MGARPGTNNGGGPRTLEGRQRALANLDPWASVTHGLYCRPRAPRCDTCPEAGSCAGSRPGVTCDPAEVRGGIVAQVMGLPHILEEERPEVERYAALCLRQVCPWLWPAPYSLRSPRGLARLRRDLGLTPQGLSERRRRERLRR